MGQRLRTSDPSTLRHQEAKPKEGATIEMKSEDMDTTVNPMGKKELGLQQELSPKEVDAHQEEHVIHVQAMEEYHFDNVKFFHHYFKGKPGVIIEDMLMAHAYAFHMNGTYGGCCARANINIERNVELLELLGLK